MYEYVIYSTYDHRNRIYVLFIYFYSHIHYYLHRMHERPKEEDLFKPKDWNGKRWWYCHPDTGGKCDGEYRRHEPKDCQGKAFKGKRRKTSSREDKKDGPSNPGKRELKVAEALSTIVDNQETDSDSSKEGYES